MKKKVNKKIIGTVIVAILVVGGAAGIYMSNQNKAIEVNTSTVLTGDMAKYVEELGVVKVENHVNIYSPTAGKVTEVLVDIGDKVKEGDILIKLDGAQLSRQIEELAAQRAAILAQYNEAKQPTDKKNIEKLDLEITSIEKRIITAEEKVENNKVLYDSGAISNEDYQNALRNLDAEKSNLDRVRLDLELLKKPVSSNVIAQYEAQLKQLDLQREELVKSGDDFTIVASMDGTILQKDVERGSYVQPGAFLMGIGDLGDLYIESDILVGDISNIYEGASVIISNKDLGIFIEGVVSKIHPNAFSKISNLGIEQKRIKVDIQLLDTVNNLRPGYDLDIKIITEKRDSALLIPENAVFKIDNKSYVFVNENDKAVLREVETGIESERKIEILSGLKDGDIVVLSPDNDTEEGISIKSID